MPTPDHPSNALRRRMINAALLVILLASGFLAARRMSNEFRRLLIPVGQYSGIDLRMRWNETQLYFTGQPVYQAKRDAVYPPQTYLILRPIIGHVSLQTARWVWAVTSLVGMLFLGGLIACHLKRESSGLSSAQTADEKKAPHAPIHPLLLFPAAILYVAAMYPTGLTIGNGQLILHILCFLLPAILMLWAPRCGWGWDLLIALLLQAPLAKLTVALPFMWIVLLIPLARRATILAGLQPAFFTAGVYVLLTFISAAFRPEPLIRLLQLWIANMPNATNGGYGNIHSLMDAIGLKQSMPVSMALGALFGVWVHFARRADPWILIGATALLARLWVYHRAYDDLLALPALVTLARLTLCNPAINWVAMTLLVIEGGAMLIPAHYITIPNPISSIAHPVECAIWIAMLAYLLWMGLAPSFRRDTPALREPRAT